jgi:hypothetical protein
VYKSVQNYSNVSFPDNPIHLHSSIFGPMKAYISERSGSIYDLYLKCLSFGLPLPFNTPDYCLFRSEDREQYINRRNILTKNLQKREKIHEPMPITTEVQNMFRDSSLQRQLEIVQTIQFEHSMFELKMHTCSHCKKRAMSNHFTRKKKDVCDQCHNKQGSPDTFLEGLLPIWKDDTGRIRHDMPDVLKGLTLGEQMLIQKNAILVPLCNMWQGVLGLNGHTCMFRKDIMSVVNELPRRVIEVLFMTRNIESKTHPGEFFKQIFKIRRSKVLQALRWLKKHHTGYKDIVINEENLSWLDGAEEGVLQGDSLNITTKTKKDVLADIEKAQEKVSVSESQTMDNEATSENTFEVTGTSMEMQTSNYTEENQRIAHELKQSQSISSSKIPLLAFPQIDEEPIDEYNTPGMLADAYPWLFPGGVGDISGQQYDKALLNYWAGLLLHYEDGRFMRDKVFSFHLYNIIQRHANNKAAYYFVQSFISDDAVTVEQIKEQIEKGNTAFVGKLQTFAAGKIRGSDSFWRSKKNELESWLSYHLEAGHGPPTLFLTLSCAEFWWKDLQRLLYEKCVGTEDETLADSMMAGNFTAKQNLLDKYTAVVQEFFQIRLDNWMETVGKETFGISHYWLRFEFTKGRGQIHAHILAITHDTGMIQAYHIAETEEEKTAVISEYAREKLGMTADLPSKDPFFQANETDNSGEVPALSERCEDDDDCEEVPALSRRFVEVTDQKSDICQLCQACHMHKCNGFCMRKFGKR